jgi:tRNA-dihydrouridine synthase B
MRKFGIKYSQMHPRSDEVREAFVAVTQPGEWKTVLERWYSEDLPGRWPDHRYNLEMSCEA